MIGYKSFYKTIRIVTLAPIMALITILLLYSTDRYIFKGISNFIFSVIFFVIVPLLAYPLQLIIPKIKSKGRTGQRKLAIIMAVIGYILGIIYAIFMNITSELMLMYLVYLISGILIFIFNKILKIKASGHACGVVGPIVYLGYFYKSYALLGIPLIFIVYYSSIKMKRHSIKELLYGSILPIIAFIISYFIVF